MFKTPCYYSHSIKAPYLVLFHGLFLNFFCRYCLYFFICFCPPLFSVRFWNAFYSSSSGAIPSCFMYMVAASFQKSEREYCLSCCFFRSSTYSSIMSRVPTDACTVIGTRLLLPFSGLPYAISYLSIWYSF